MIAEEMIDAAVDDAPLVAFRAVPRAGSPSHEQTLRCVKHDGGLRVCCSDAPARCQPGGGCSFPAGIPCREDSQRLRASRETLVFSEWAVPGLNRGPSDFQEPTAPRRNARKHQLYKHFTIDALLCNVELIVHQNALKR